MTQPNTNLIAVTTGHHYFGILETEKTDIELPVEGDHYLVLCCTSMLSAEEAVSNGISSINYGTLMEEVDDLDNGSQRKIILRSGGSDNVDVFFECREVDESVRLKNGKRVSLLEVMYKVPEKLAGKISMSIDANS